MKSPRSRRADGREPADAGDEIVGFDGLRQGGGVVLPGKLDLGDMTARADRRPHPLHQLDRGRRADRKAPRRFSDRAATLDASTIRSRGSIEIGAGMTISRWSQPILSNRRHRFHAIGICFRHLPEPKSTSKQLARSNSLKSRDAALRPGTTLPCHDALQYGLKECTMPVVEPVPGEARLRATPIPTIPPGGH
jgi:hypothetical protein